MQNLQSFLKKFSHLESSELVVKKIVTQTFLEIHKKMKITLSPESITYQKGIVFLKLRNTLKQGIFLDKIKLLEKVNKKLPPHIQVKDIR